MPESPLFSIIIPTYNRCEALTACLAAVGRLEYPRADFEVIVVDDGGKPEAGEPARARTDGVDIRHIRLSRNEGPAAARNLGAARAKGKYLAFLDDDCRPAPDWLQNMEAALAGAPASAAGGQVVNGTTGSLCAAASHAVLIAAYQHHNPDTLNASFLATSNLVVPARGFREAGGFDPKFRVSEDREFCERWRRKGFRLVYVRGAVVEHHCASTFSGFWRRHIGYGRGAYRFRKMRARQRGMVIRLEPLAFYGRLLSAPFEEGFSFRTLRIAVLALVSQVASTVGFLSEWRCAGRGD